MPLLTDFLFFLFFIGALIASATAFYYYKKTSSLQREWKSLQSRLQELNLEKSQLDIELKELKNTLTTNFLYDPVTGLPGKHIFDDWLIQTLNQSIRHKLVFSVILLDFDDFKMINHVMGQEVADALLKEMAQRFQTCIRKIDTISRFAGDSFAFLLPQITKAETAIYVAQRLLESAASPFYIDGQELFVTASIGIALYPDDGQDIKTLLKNAEIALHQAKASGGNTHQFFREELYNLTHREIVLSSSLRGNSIYQEFLLYYLPQVNTQTKEISSMEALLRWHHPDLGLIQPHDFLRLAENNGTINEIGDWVLKNTCLQYQKWLESGFKLGSISVNVSLRQLENTNFTYRVSQILQETKLEPRHLILEISESVILPRLELVEKTLHMLKHLGVQVAIDDFGTGFLSLQHLRRFPVSYLKIDTTLTHDIVTNNESESIVKMIINLANSLRIKAVAEGVENEAQKQKIQQLGCYLMQGFYFGKPMLAHEYTQEVVANIYQQV